MDDPTVHKKRGTNAGTRMNTIGVDALTLLTPDALAMLSSLLSLLSPRPLAHWPQGFTPHNKEIGSPFVVASAQNSRQSKEFPKLSCEAEIALLPSSQHNTIFELAPITEHNTITIILASRRTTKIRP